MEYFLEHEEAFSDGMYEQYAVKVRFCAGGLSALYGEWFTGNLPLTLTELTMQAEKLIESMIETE